MDKYNFKKIEKKWQNKWDKSEIYKAADFSKIPKYYCLIEFPYPSGAGLHVGHLRSHIAIDIVARKKRMSGYNVLYPIGWDAFGLPTENFAIKTKTHPTIVTKKNIRTFTRQIKSYGPSFDWSREVDTTDPEYYKWTQWIFLKLFNSFYNEKRNKAMPIEKLKIPKGMDFLQKKEYVDSKRLAYEAEMAINWCPSCKIGLANEEVVDGKCERCHAPTEKKVKKQWMLRITKYAQRLIDDLDTVDYLEKIKTQQINWIGRSEGAEIDFSILGSEEKIKVFTTRPDTIFGCTYMVLAPEHELVTELEGKISNINEVKEYITRSKNKSDLDRTDLAKEKTGVELKGIKAINPLSGENIPVWIADYVLSGYGTGAIMAVPAHDERDFEFAKRFGLKIKEVVAPYLKDDPKSNKTTEKRDVVTAIVKNSRNNTYLCLKWKKTEWQSFPSGGIDDQNLIDAAKREVMEETGYKNIKYIKQIGDSIYAEFYRPHKDSNVFANFKYLLFELEDEEREEVAEKEKNQHEAVWVKESEVNAFINVWNQKLAWKRYIEGDFAYCDEGININSDFLDGLKTKESKNKTITWLSQNNFGKKSINYKLRDWVFSRQHYWGEPIPIIKCKLCGNVPLSEKELPLKLPNVKNYEPTDSGESPLANITKWTRVKCPVCKNDAVRETDTMPNWAGSSWYFLRYIDPNNKKQFASEKKIRYWMPVDLYNGGMEHTTLHLLYSRFWHKFLFDLGYVNNSEPYKMRRSHGMILAEDGQKMSKSRGNVINPDDIIGKYGADTVRLYEMFMGPYSEAIPWSTTSLIGMNRFLERIWNLQEKVASDSKGPRSNKKSDTILVATNNQGKLKELKDHFKDFNIICLGDLKKRYKEPVENGKTYEDNSLIKAKYYAKKTGYMTVADDSGFGVNALGGKPGVYSSRFAQGDYTEAQSKILNELFAQSDRSAYFKSVITIYDPENNTFKQFDGLCNGVVSVSPKGTGGFGYDPIFIPQGETRTFGEMANEDKYKYDHRKKAVSKLIAYLDAEKARLDADTLPILHRTIKKVTEDIDNMKFNTAISQLMILSNEYEKVSAISKNEFKYLITMLSPIAPHISEEIWSNLGGKKSVHLENWPEYDRSLAKEKEIELVVQINGKVREKLSAPAGISEEDAKKLAFSSEKVKKWIEGKEIRKLLFVKGRLINIVV